MEARGKPIWKGRDKREEGRDRKERREGSEEEREWEAFHLTLVYKTKTVRPSLQLL